MFIIEYILFYDSLMNAFEKLIGDLVGNVKIIFIIFSA